MRLSNNWQLNNLLMCSKKLDRYSLLDPIARKRMQGMREMDTEVKKFSKFASSVPVS
jgi:hypothetical protein